MNLKGFGATGIQVLLEGYHFSCAECQRVCPVGRIEQETDRDRSE